MKVPDLDKLKKTTRSGDLYDLFEVRFQFPAFNSQELGTQLYTVKRGEEMRMDLICQSIYGKTDYIDFLCFVNSISNPVNIRLNQIIIYYPEENIPAFIFEPKSDDITQIVAKANRGTKPDPSREEFLDNNLTLPPNILEQPVEQIVIKGSQIRLGNGS
jgi:hypothetical protein